MWVAAGYKVQGRLNGELKNFQCYLNSGQNDILFDKINLSRSEEPFSGVKVLSCPRPPLMCHRNLPKSQRIFRRIKQTSDKGMIC